VENVHVAVDKRDGEVTFLRTVRDGPTNRSYGVHVADLAGVPAPVVSRAGTVLDRLREEKAIEAKGGARGGGGERGGFTGTADGDTKQVVFDLSSGSFSESDDAGSTRPAPPAPEEVETGRLRGRHRTAPVGRGDRRDRRSRRDR